MTPCFSTKLATNNNINPNNSKTRIKQQDKSNKPTNTRVLMIVALYRSLQIQSPPLNKHQCVSNNISKIYLDPITNERGKPFWIWLHSVVTKNSIASTSNKIIFIFLVRTPIENYVTQIFCWVGFPLICEAQQV